ncbi:hypothetical protein T440DRAFT_538431 [Plenodomus tracheiphilus IPT5]|uniref:Uncharacterized protein n=1 Tax=Plenodomus tracheiphilus IPT5 TaxID=1408161 RepID=A0A6A7AXX3_9PLEO|nr:hypothetical protein T440DRAFT_538431 [Plenodomus tracheiphilus IPT5]
MCGQHTNSHALSLRLENGWLNTDDKFQLNRHRPHNLGQIVVTNFETESSVTLVCNNIHAIGKSRKLDLWEALKSGLVELHSMMGQLNIPPKFSPKHTQVEVGVYADTTRLEWKNYLQTGRTYDLRLSKNFGSRNDMSLDQRLAVHDDPAPPELFASLEMPTTCHCTGNTPFTFAIKHSSDSKDALTIDKSHSPFSVFGGDIGPLDWLLWLYRFYPHPSFPFNGDLVEILLDKPWCYECTLENLEHEDDTVRIMLGLEPGQTYKSQIADYALSGF